MQSIPNHGRAGISLGDGCKVVTGGQSFKLLPRGLTIAENKNKAPKSVNDSMCFTSLNVAYFIVFFNLVVFYTFLGFHNNNGFYFGEVETLTPLNTPVLVLCEPWCIKKVNKKY